MNFRLAGTVLASQKKQTQRLRDDDLHRFHERVSLAIRNSDVSDLAEPDLGLIRRRILATSSDLFGERVLRELTFSDFRLYDQ